MAKPKGMRGPPLTRDGMSGEFTPRVPQWPIEEERKGVPEEPITDAMVDAGLDGLFEYDSDLANAKACVRKIFRDMLAARDAT